MIIDISIFFCYITTNCYLPTAESIWCRVCMFGVIGLHSLDENTQAVTVSSDRYCFESVTKNIYRNTTNGAKDEKYKV